MIRKQGLADISMFQQVFRDNKQFINIVKIVDQEVDTEGGSYNLNVNLVNTDTDTYVTATFNPSIQGPILKNELWLACFINGDLNNGFLIKRICNVECKLHAKARVDETVVTSKKGKNINLSNNTDAKLKENAVLGKELVSWMLQVTSQIRSLATKIDVMNAQILAHTHIVTLPTLPNTPPTGWVPVVATDVTIAITRLETFIETDKFLSDLVFIQEKGLKG